MTNEIEKNLEYSLSCLRKNSHALNDIEALLEAIYRNPKPCISISTPEAGCHMTLSNAQREVVMTLLSEEADHIRAVYNKTKVDENGKLY